MASINSYYKNVKNYTWTASSSIQQYKGGCWNSSHFSEGSGCAASQSEPHWVLSTGSILICISEMAAEKRLNPYSEGEPVRKEICTCFGDYIRERPVTPVSHPYPVQFNSNTLYWLQAFGMEIEALRDPNSFIQDWNSWASCMLLVYPRPIQYKPPVWADLVEHLS